MRKIGVISLLLVMNSVALGVEIPKYIIDLKLSEPCLELVTVTEERRENREEVSPDMAQGYFHIVERHKRDIEEASEYCEEELSFYSEDEE